jgi:hypothetical protein
MCPSIHPSIHLSLFFLNSRVCLAGGLLQTASVEDSFDNSAEFSITRFTRRRSRSDGREVADLLFLHTDLSDSRDDVFGLDLCIDQSSSSAVGAGVGGEGGASADYDDFSRNVAGAVAAAAVVNDTKTDTASSSSVLLDSSLPSSVTIRRRNNPNPN